MTSSAAFTERTLPPRRRPDGRRQHTMEGLRRLAEHGGRRLPAASHSALLLLPSATGPHSSCFGAPPTLTPVGLSPRKLKATRLLRGHAMGTARASLCPPMMARRLPDALARGPTSSLEKSVPALGPTGSAPALWRCWDGGRQPRAPLCSWPRGSLGSAPAASNAGTVPERVSPRPRPGPSWWLSDSPLPAPRAKGHRAPLQRCVLKTKKGTGK